MRNIKRTILAALFLFIALAPKGRGADIKISEGEFLPQATPALSLGIDGPLSTPQGPSPFSTLSPNDENPPLENGSIEKLAPREPALLLPEPSLTPALDQKKRAAPQNSRPKPMGKAKVPFRINKILSAVSLPSINPDGNPLKSAALNSLFDGSSKNSHGTRFSPASHGRREAAFIVNDEGVQISGKAAEYYQAVRRFVEEYKNKIDLSESLGVMDDSYADVWAKLKVIESVVPNHEIAHHNEHLKETLTWVDGVAQVDGKRTVIYTHRVFFHHALNPQSEIDEGIRRVDAYLKETTRSFSKNNKAEQVLGPLDQVVLGFDTRGYDPIKSFLKIREAEIAKEYGNRFRFVYLDDIASVPKTVPEMRESLNKLISQYKGNSLQNIVEGVIYSRYTGLLLELKTLEHYYKQGYQILQSGREIFDAEGRYVTELDAVVKSPEKTTYLVEAKSSRVLLPQDRVLEGKIIYKLDAYKKNQALLEKEIGAPLNVVFSMDLGLPEAGDRTHGQNAEREKRQQALMTFLKDQAPSLSRRYGFPVSFLFIDGTAQN